MLSEIKNFIVLAECKNYTTASNILFRSQSTLSKQISKLEEELGVVLFKRTTRSVELTAAGQALLEKSHVFYNFCNTIQNNYPGNAFVNSDRGLIIGIADGMKTEPIVPILSEYFLENPKENVSYMQDKDDGLFTSLLENETDVIYTFKTLIEDYVQFDYTIVKPLRLRVVLWKGHPLASRERIKLSELSEEFFISNTGAPNLLKRQLHALFEANGFFPKICAKVESNPLSLLMVSSQQGIMLTTFGSEIDSPKSNLVFKEIDDNGQKDLLENASVLVWSKKAYHENPSTRKFADFLKNYEKDHLAMNQ